MGQIMLEGLLLVKRAETYVREDSRTIRRITVQLITAKDTESNFEGAFFDTLHREGLRPYSDMPPNSRGARSCYGLSLS